MYMMIGPMFMLGLNGNVNFKFEDFDDLRENPVAAPFMASFADLFEGMIGKPPGEFLEDADGKDP